MIMVVKWDGRREPFQREKIVRTLMRIGASKSIAEEIARRVEDEAYDGISTSEILDVAFKHLSEYEPTISLRRDLKSALGALRPKPDFEEYIRILFRERGYEVEGNRILKGRCATHEIDGIIHMEGKTIYLEVKHHSNSHTYTPFEVALAAKAKWDDLVEGYRLGLNPHRIDGVLIATNTKLTKHARGYADCVGMRYLGWNTPEGRGIDQLIEETGHYPITILRSLSREELKSLSAEGILTLKQLLSAQLPPSISSSRASRLRGEARKILELSGG